MYVIDLRIKDDSAPLDLQSFKVLGGSYTIYKLTSKGYTDAIESVGAQVVVVGWSYDDAVRQADQNAQRNGREVASDTACKDYEDIPKWAISGYTTLLIEAQEQLAAKGLSQPTDGFGQARLVPWPPRRSAFT